MERTKPQQAFAFPCQLHISSDDLFDLRSRLFYMVYFLMRHDVTVLQ